MARAHEVRGRLIAAALAALAACAGPGDGRSDVEEAAADARPADGRAASARADGPAGNAAGDAAERAAELAAAGYRVATSAGGAFTAAWRPEGGGPVPRNEPFALELLVFEGSDLDRPLAGADVQVSAWMPDHGHGMTRRPQAHEVAPGVLRVRGMLLHMAGLWQVFVDVVRDGAAERAEFEVVL